MHLLSFTINIVMKTCRFVVLVWENHTLGSLLKEERCSLGKLYIHAWSQIATVLRSFRLCHVVTMHRIDLRRETAAKDFNSSPEPYCCPYIAGTSSSESIPLELTAIA